MSQDKGFKTIEYQELLYLPANHSLAKREFEYHNSVYRISDYSHK